MRVFFGTAHLLGTGPGPALSRALLRSAWEAGCRSFDTAPAYGGGHVEPALAAFLAETGRAGVSTKVGLLPVVGSPALRRMVVGTARRVLPGRVVDRLRQGAARATTGHFAPQEVEASIERSLDRFGPLERLLLHEVLPDDVSDELLELLQRWVDDGAVRAVGTATSNEVTVEVLRRAPGLLTVAHIEAGPFATPVDLPDSVSVRVGHGLLGPGGDALRLVRNALATPSAAGDVWRQVVEGTAFAGPNGVARALLARAGSRGLTDVIVATSSTGRVPESLRAPLEPVPADVGQAFDAVLDEVRARE